MIKHIILWKLKSEMTAEEKSAAKLEAKTRLESLNGRIDGLVSLRVVTDGLSTSNADMMLDSVHHNRSSRRISGEPHAS